MQAGDFHRDFVVELDAGRGHVQPWHHLNLTVNPDAAYAVSAKNCSRHGVGSVMIDVLSRASVAPMRLVGRKSADQPEHLGVRRRMRIAKLIKRVRLGQPGKLDERANTLTPRKLHLRRTTRQKNLRNLA